MQLSKGLCGQGSVRQILSKGRDLHGEIERTRTRYNLQGQLYLKQDLDRRDGSVQSAVMGNRLAYFRKKAGFSQESLGKALNSGRSTVTKLERGEIPLSDRWLNRISAVLNCTPLDILGDEVPVVGKIGAGGSIIFEDLGADYFVSRPPDVVGEVIGLEVDGFSMLPKFDPGDVVYISRASDGVDARDIGAICACRLVSGETYLKILARGSAPGRWTLRSYNAGDMEDVELVWATAIRAITPRHARRYM